MNEGIVRNRGKIQAIILNAREIKIIQKEFGTVQKYITSLDKSNNYQNAVEELSSRFKWLGPSSSSLFLHTVGEEINHEGWM
jgi:3-methyladenine DNA glycosylase Tag